jgi:hypothetical protein
MNKSPGGGSATDVVKEQVSQGAQQVQQTASQAAQSATQQAESFADSKKNQAAQSLKTVAGTLHKSGQELDTNGETMAGTVIDKAASGADSVATYLQNESVTQMVGDVENFARSNTWAFLGGAFVLGLAATRFLKSSTPPPPSPSRPGYRGGYPYGTAGYRGGAYGTIPREGQYGGFISGQTGDTLGTRGTPGNYGPGQTEGNDGTAS